MASTGREVMYVDTDHGVYDVLPVRPFDDGPATATHAVYYEDGTLAGYAGEDGSAWNAAGKPWDARFGDLASAVQVVAKADRLNVMAAYPYLFSE